MPAPSGQYRDIDRSIAQINGVVLALLNQFHAHGVDENLAMASTSTARYAICRIFAMRASFDC